MTWRQPSRRVNPIMYRSRNVGEAVPSRKRRILASGYCSRTPISNLLSIVSLVMTCWGSQAHPNLPAVISCRLPNHVTRWGSSVGRPASALLWSV